MLRCRPSLCRATLDRRKYHDYVRFATPGGAGRVPLASPKVIGIVNSRGNRSHQEDFYAFATLSINPEELRLNVKKAHGIDWDPASVGDLFARQVVMVGIYDGHGGSAVAQYLRQELHGIMESVNKSMVPELYAWLKELGGYFKRFRGGLLAPWIEDGNVPPEFDLGARATAAFFEVDRNLAADFTGNISGATASVALLHSLDAPATPFFASKQLSLTVAHCGDTRVLLASTDGGRVHVMTENHHAESRTESARLRRMMGSSLVTDSFGESRWMGALANTRGLGDLRYKRHGVTAEPDVRSKLLTGSEWSCMVLVSDGISSMVSDQEVVDLTRGCTTPKMAADRILDYSEALGGEDNATALVVPLAGWANTSGPDQTKELREYKRRQAEGTERLRRM